MHGAGAIGIAAYLAAIGAFAIAPQTARLGVIGVIVTAFLAAFALYELALYAASFALPSSAEAFSLPVAWRIFYVNVIALAGLLIGHRVALAIGLIVRSNEPTRTAATA